MEIEKAKLVELVKALREEYGRQLEALPFKPKVRDTLRDGFTDGARTGVFECAKMLGVTIKD